MRFARLFWAGSVMVVAAIGILLLSRVAQSPQTSNPLPQLPAGGAVSAPAPSLAPAPAAESAEPASSEASAPPPLAVNVHGVVLDEKEQKPIADATVRIELERPEAPVEGTAASVASSIETHTDASGAYTLTLTLDDAYILSCHAPGYIASQQPLPVGQDQDMQVDFILSRGGVFCGIVTDAGTKAPVPGLVVTATQTDAVPETDVAARQWSATTGADGAYSITGLSAGHYRIDVMTREKGYLFVAGDLAPVELTEREYHPNVDFTVELGAVVEGVVHDASDAPVEGAKVEPMPAQWMTLDANALRGVDVRVYQPVIATTDAQGQFRIAGLEYGTKYRLYASKPGFIEVASKDVEAARGAQPSNQTLTFAKGTRISGMARFDNGAPAGQITLVLQPQLRPLATATPATPVTILAAPDGAFVFDGVGAGRYAIQQGTGSNLVGPDNIVYVEANGAEDISGLVLTAKKQATTIEGVVLDPQGTPVPALKVEAGPAGSVARRAFSAKTGPDGKFTLKGLEGPRYYDVIASSTVGMAIEQKVEVGSAVTLRLTPPNSLAGVVVDAKGAPVPGVTVTLTIPEDQFPSVLFPERPDTQTGPDGRFTFKNVPMGTYTATVCDKKRGSGASDPIGMAPGIQRNDLRIAIKPNPSFGGEVVDGAGKPLADVEVALYRQSPNEMADLVRMAKPGQVTSEASATTNASGAFTMDNVVPGIYMLVAQHKDYARTQMRGVVVMPGQDITGFRVGMAFGGTVSGSCYADGKPKPGVAVQLIGPGGVYMVMTDVNGRYTVAHMLAGAYILQTIDMARMTQEGTHAAATSPTHVIDVHEGETVTYDDTQTRPGVTVTGTILTGEKGRMIAVTLRMPGGRPPEEVRPGDLKQAVEQARFIAGKAIAGPDGAFEIRNVPPGTYFLEATVFDFDPANAADLEASMNTDRAPRVRQEVIVGDAPLRLPPIILPLGG